MVNYLLVTGIVLLGLIFLSATGWLPEFGYKKIKRFADEYRLPRVRRPGDQMVIFTPAGTGEIKRKRKNHIMLKGENFWRGGYSKEAGTLINLRGEADDFEGKKLFVSNIGLDRKEYKDHYYPKLNIKWSALQSQRELADLGWAEIEALKEDLEVKPQKEVLNEVLTIVKKINEGSVIGILNNPKSKDFKKTLEK